MEAHHAILSINKKTQKINAKNIKNKSQNLQENTTGIVSTFNKINTGLHTRHKNANNKNE